MSMTKLVSLLVLVLGAAVLVGCVGTGTEVIVVEPEKQSIGVEKYDMRNCQGEEEMRMFLAEGFEVEKAIHIAGQATGISTGDIRPIPDDVMIELEEQVDKAYQQMYEESIRQIETTEIVTPPDKIRLYQIHIILNTCQSEVSFNMSGRRYTAEYTYELRVPDEQGFWEMSCTA